MGSKFCNGCKETKPFSEFYKGPGKFGLRSRCKACDKKYAQAHQLEYQRRPSSRAKQSEYQRRYKSKPGVRDAIRKKDRECSKRPGARNASRERQRTSDVRFKSKARSAVKMALKTGKLIRPERCTVCGEIPGKMNNGRSLLRADHYKGYEEKHWFDIRWICAACDQKKEGEKRRTW